MVMEVEGVWNLGGARIMNFIKVGIGTSVCGCSGSNKLTIEF